MDWIWILVALAAGLLIGGIVTYATMRRRYGDQESVVQLRNEFEAYREKVTGHFVETADLVNTLTRSYKNVYDHLEEGAYELVGEETLRKRLDTVDEAPVMLEYIGQRRRDADGRIAEHRKPSLRASGEARPVATEAPEPVVAEPGAAKTEVRAEHEPARPAERHPTLGAAGARDAETQVEPGEPLTEDERTRSGDEPARP